MPGELSTLFVLFCFVFRFVLFCFLGGWMFGAECQMGVKKVIFFFCKRKV